MADRRAVLELVVELEKGLAELRQLGVVGDASIGKVEAAAKDLQSELVQSEGSTENLGQAFEQLEGAVEELDGELVKAAGSAEIFFDKAGRARDAKGRFVTLGGAARGAAGEVDALGRSFQKANDAQSSFASGGPTLGQSVKNLRQRIRNIRLEIVAFTAAIGLFVKSAADAALAMERVERRLKFVTDSSEGAQEQLAFLRAETERLGAPFEQTAEQYSKLAAALKGKIPLDEIQGLATGILEANTALGLTPPETGRVINALQQMASKGKVSAEELRQQLAESLPGATAIFARALGVSEVELNKMLERGEVLAQDALPKLGAELRRTFGKEAQDNVGSVAANLNRLSNIAQVVRSSFGAGLLDEFNNGLKEAGINTDQLGPAMEQLGRSVGSVAVLFIRLADFVGNAAGRLGDFLATATETAARLGDLVPGLGDMAERAREVAEGFREGAEANRNFITRTEETTGALQEQAEAARGAADGIRENTTAREESSQATEAFFEEGRKATEQLYEEIEAADEAAAKKGELTEQTEKLTEAEAKQADGSTRATEALTEQTGALANLQRQLQESNRRQDDAGDATQQVAENTSEQAQRLEELQSALTLTADESNELADLQFRFADVQRDTNEALEEGTEQVTFYGAGSAEAAAAWAEFAEEVRLSDAAVSSGIDTQTEAQGNLEALTQTVQDNALAYTLFGERSNEAAEAQARLGDATEQAESQARDQLSTLREVVELKRELLDINEKLYSQESGALPKINEELEVSRELWLENVGAARELKDCVGEIGDVL